MLPSPTLSLHDAADLRVLLKIRSNTNFGCHGKTQKHTLCGIRIAAANLLLVDALLEKVAAAAGLEEKLQLLTRMAPLLLCKRHHQGKQVVLIADWEDSLRAAVPSFKTESDDEPGIFAEGVRVCSAWAGRRTTFEGARTTPVRMKTEAGPYVKVEPLSDDHEAAPRNPRKDALQERTFIPYSSPRNTRSLNIHIMSVLSKPLSPKALSSTSKAGYVYVYTFTSNPDTPIRYLKIGHSIDYDRRLKEWQSQCSTKPRLLCHYQTSRYQKVERIVHAQLANQRLLEEECGGCRKKHNEWFDVKVSRVSALLGLWTEWSWREPYDAQGKLKVEWARRLKDVDLDDPDCWTRFVERD